MATLNKPGPAVGDYFGGSVAISGSRVVVGAYSDDTGALDAGSAFVYDLSSGTPTVPVATLNNPSPAPSDYFGYSVAIDGTTVAIGTLGDDTTTFDKGAAYVFGPGSGPGPGSNVIIATNNGATGAGLPTGTKFFSFTAPDVGVFGGRVQTPAGQKLDAVFQEDGTVLLRGQQMVAVDPAGGGDMGMIAKLNPPTGDAVLATLDRRSGATAADDQVLFMGLMSGTPEVMVRKGQEIPGLPGVKLKSFLTLDGNGATTFFSGKLSGTGVNGGNNTAIFAANAADGFKMIVRKGQVVGAKQVKIIATLVGQAGSLAEGRWRGGTNEIGMRLTFTDKTQALYLVPASATSPDDWLRIAQSGDAAGADVPGAELKSFMLPANAPGATVFDSLLRTGPGNITRKNSRAVFDALGVETRGPISLRLLAQVAGPAPAQSNFQRLLNTLAGLGRASTVIANSTLPGENRSRGTIYDARQDGQLVPIARLGGSAPEGGRFARFVSVAKPDGLGYGALVSALLGVSGSEGVTAKNRAALYARDSGGELRRVLRAGDMVESAGPGSARKPVKSFVALTAAPGSIGAARGYDDTGRVNVLVTFGDRTQAVVRIQVP
ncbi:MAG: FG-GAP repeat protein [Chthoniobacteraceae bacterium]